jgi:hypothetical protein
MTAPSTTTWPDQDHILHGYRQWSGVLDPLTRRRLFRLFLLGGVAAAALLEEQQLHLDRPPEPNGGGFAIGVSAIGGLDGIGGQLPSLPNRVADAPSPRR